MVLESSTNGECFTAKRTIEVLAIVVQRSSMLVIQQVRTSSESFTANVTFVLLLFFLTICWVTFDHHHVHGRMHGMHGMDGIHVHTDHAGVHYHA